MFVVAKKLLLAPFLPSFQYYSSSSSLENAKICFFLLFAIDFVLLFCCCCSQQPTHHQFVEATSRIGLCLCAKASRVWDDDVEKIRVEVSGPWQGKARRNV